MRTTTVTVHHVCLACGYPGLNQTPRTANGGSYEICHSCGFEYGVTDDDLGFSYETWRQRWIERGMPWDGEGLDQPPAGWDPARQLALLADAAVQAAHVTPRAGTARIVLTATISSDGLPPSTLWESVPEGALRYECFLGDLRFVGGDADFSTEWGWVPVWDLALGLLHVLDTLKSSGAARFEFTESEAFISFVREADDVHVSASYTDDVVTIEHAELLVAAHTFVDELSRNLVAARPSLQRNPWFVAAIEASDPGGAA